MINLIQSQLAVRVSRAESMLAEAQRVRHDMHSNFWSGERNRVGVLLHQLRYELEQSTNPDAAEKSLKDCILGALGYFGPLNEKELMEKVRARGLMFTDCIIVTAVRELHYDLRIRAATGFDRLTYKL